MSISKISFPPKDKSYTVLMLHKKEKFSVKDFSSKCEQIPRRLRIWSHLLKKSVRENFIFLRSVMLGSE